MKKYVLNYYSAFRCAAGACKHTCCAGWELNIDAETLCGYKNEPSAYALALKKGVNFKKSQFRRDKAGRCAFLNGEGLCELILNLGEQRLCQVCRDHPRFRSFFGDREETGLGFCCEEAARLILSFPQKIELLLEEGCEEEGRGVGGNPNAQGADGNPNAQGAGGNPIEGATAPQQGGESVPLDFNQQNVLNFREKAIRIVQNRTETIENRVQSLLKLCLASPAQSDEKAVLKRFLSLERLDKAWTRRLKMLKDRPLIAPVKEELSLCCEQFLVNSLYRYLSDAEDTAWVRARAVACVFAWWVVQAVALQNAPDGAAEGERKLFFDVVEAARAFSCEVDYSQKNLNRLFAFAYRFVKI